jgi:hypothetical protein
MLDQAMSFAEFALICTYSVISVLTQIKFFLDFPDASFELQIGCYHPTLGPPIAYVDFS